MSYEVKTTPEASITYRNQTIQPDGPVVKSQSAPSDGVQAIKPDEPSVIVVSNNNDCPKLSEKDEKCAVDALANSAKADNVSAEDKQQVELVIKTDKELNELKNSLKEDLKGKFSDEEIEKIVSNVINEYLNSEEFSEYKEAKAKFDGLQAEYDKYLENKKEHYKAKNPNATDKELKECETAAKDRYNSLHPEFAYYKSQLEASKQQKCTPDPVVSAIKPDENPNNVVIPKANK